MTSTGKLVIPRRALLQKRHAARTFALAWSPTGDLLASGSSPANHAVSHPIGIWDASTGERHSVYRGLSVEAPILAWAPDGDRLAAASCDKTIQVWDRRTGKQLWQLGTPKPIMGWNVATLAWSPDGSYLATAVNDPNSDIVIWDSQRWRPVQHISTKSPYSITQVAWSPDGSRVAVVAGGTSLQVFDPLSGVELCRLDGPHNRWSHSCSWSPEGRYLAFDSRGSIAIWDLGMPAVSGARAEPGALPHADHAAASAAPVNAPAPLHTIEIGANHVQSFWSPARDDPTLAVIDGNDATLINLYQPLTGQYLFSWRVRWALGMAWAPDGRRLACGCGTNLIQVCPA